MCVNKLMNAGYSVDTGYLGSTLKCVKIRIICMTELDKWVQISVLSLVKLPCPGTIGVVMQRSILRSAGHFGPPGELRRICLAPNRILPANTVSWNTFAVRADSVKRS